MNDKLLNEIQKNNRFLVALLTLQTRQYEGLQSNERIELLLANSGLGYQEIAEVLGKKPDAVRMFLKRNQKKITKE